MTMRERHQSDAVAKITRRQSPLTSESIDYLKKVIGMTCRPKLNVDQGRRSRLSNVCIAWCPRNIEGCTICSHVGIQENG